MFADVTSANVVGYQEIQAEDGTQLMQGCQFMTVGGQPVDIQDIVFKSNGEVSKSNCDIWWWDPKKEGGMGYVEAKRSAFYYDFEKDQRVMTVCWVDKNSPQTTKPILMQKTFAPGEGFFCQPMQEKPTLSISGEVWGSNNTSDEVRSIDFLEDGTQIMVCNPFPVELDIQDIVFTSNGDVAKSGCDIWWWDPKKEGGAGYVEAKRSQFYYDFEKDQRVMTVCWVDKNSPQTTKPILIQKKFKAGEGFFVQPMQENPKLHFPNPFYKAAE